MTNQDLLGQYPPKARESMLEIMVDAAYGDHDLGGFEPVDDYNGDPNGYEARCRRCNLTAWVDDSGLMYSLLADTCPGDDSHGGNNIDIYKWHLVFPIMMISYMPLPRVQQHMEDR